jgi:hypothetical protein
VRIDKLFDVTYGNKFDLNKMEVASAGIAFVGRKGVGQGISAFVAPIEGVEPYESGFLTVALGGSVLATFVQQFPFYTAQNVAVLKPLTDLSLEERLYYAMCIEANKFRYSTFGREANRTLRTLELPSQVPAWVRNRPMVDLPRLNGSVLEPLELTDRDQWKEFTIGSLFKVEKGTRLTRRNMTPGSVPYIGSSALNNGVTSRIHATPRFPADVLTVPYNGSVGHAFFQPEPFCAGDDVHVLTPLNQPLEKYTMLFVASVIRHEKYRFNYGRKWHLDRMRNSTIRLPVNSEGSPNWEFMSRYMQGLRFSATLTN